MKLIKNTCTAICKQPPQYILLWGCPRCDPHKIYESYLCPHHLNQANPEGNCPNCATPSEYLIREIPYHLTPPF